MANDKSLKESLLAASPFLIKILELILALIALGLIISPYSNKHQPSFTRAGIIYSTFTGAILINVLIIVSHFLKERIPKKPCLIISSFYGCLLLLTGILIIQEWKNTQPAFYPRPTKSHLDLLITSGVFSILSSIAFFTDIALTLRYG